MCGICGYLFTDAGKRADEAVVGRMADTLAHRGPDDRGIFVDGPVALGHRRLSIIDLATGHQPMLNKDRSLAIVYNGEVYNFKEIRAGLEALGQRFTTASDTEVVLRAFEVYGESCLDKFNGMFAFAIWDNRRKRLFLARDRFGKKPLYYGIFNGQFIFGSELKAVLKHPDVSREIDRTSLSKYLAYDYVPAPASIFKGIYKLNAAHWLSVEGGTVKTGQYWDLKFTPELDMDFEDLKKKLVDLFKESVQRRLVSDVPLGVFLSGGIDSSCVVAAMAELMDPTKIKTFSIGFRDEFYDESLSARIVAAHFGTDHQEEVLEPDKMLEILPTVLEMNDEPFADSSIIPTYVLSKFTREHVTVALGGDGGDELFAGYNSFVAGRLALLYERLPASMKRFFVWFTNDLLPIPAKSTSRRYRLRRFMDGVGKPLPVRQQYWLSPYPPALQRRIFADPSSLNLNIFDLYKESFDYFKAAESRNTLDLMIYVLTKTYLPGDILTKVDRASMAASLEVRAPFLDKEFAEFACTIPPRLKLLSLQKKWILKEAFKGRLPEEIINKPKHGFAVPVGRWLRKDLKSMLLAALNKEKIGREGIFDPDMVEDMVRQFLKHKHYTEREIWPLLAFELWYNKWMK